MVTATAPLRPWPGAVLVVSALLAGAIPFLLAGADPRWEIPNVGASPDPVSQAAILDHVARRPVWDPATWQAPWFWPADWGLAAMDPLTTQALLVGWVPTAIRTPAVAYNLALFLTVVATFLATAALTRRLGGDTLAMVLAAAAFTLGPYAMGHLHHLNQLPSPWLPLGILALLEMARGRVAAVGLWGIAGLLQVGSGIYGLAAWLLTMAVLAPGLVPRMTVRARWGLAGAGVVVAAAVWALSLPYQAAAASVEGFLREGNVSGPFAARIPDLWHVSPVHLWPWPPAPAGRPVLYPGLGWFLFAAVAFWWRRQRRGGGFWWAWAIAAGVGLLLAMGASHPWPGTTREIPLPYGWLQENLWPVRALRAPSRLFLPGILLISVLGALGVRETLGRSRGGARALIVLLATLAFADLAPGSADAERIQPDAAESRMLEQLAALPEGPFVFWPMPARERDEGPQEARAMLWANRTGRPLAGGSGGFVPTPLATLRREVAGDPDPRARLREAGVRWVVARGPAPGREVWRGDGWRILEVPGEAPGR